MIAFLVIIILFLGFCAVSAYLLMLGVIKDTTEYDHKYLWNDHKNINH
ncbi:hypothetical protein [Chengkuizengella axinellae]|uniref:YtzI protein n=1 Tax=Chengkuizengella axinellae TaxID=3064388 RepID=A0ABT9IT88_9BACL|nr:hypothetical protein [Chengkuizengella sp. 2205SS18-9]MDP5272574.1 hypothetical protein [Chengkuizengella sp. 2205SS18-9]